MTVTNSYKNLEGGKLFKQLLKRNGIERLLAGKKMEYEKSMIDAICIGNRPIPEYKIDMLADAFPRISPEEIVRLKEAYGHIDQQKEVGASQPMQIREAPVEYTMAFETSEIPQQVNIGIDTTPILQALSKGQSVSLTVTLTWTTKTLVLVCLGTVTLVLVCLGTVIYTVFQSINLWKPEPFQGGCGGMGPVISPILGHFLPHARLGHSKL